MHSSRRSVTRGSNVVFQIFSSDRTCIKISIKHNKEINPKISSNISLDSMILTYH